MVDGVDVCHAGGQPSSCTIECALVFTQFFTDCSTMIERILDDEFAGFEALNTQCNAFDNRELLDAIGDAECTFPAATCAEFNSLSPLEASASVGLRTADGISFETHCMLAEDFGTTGHPFTRFWHWNGGQGVAWPADSSDVLQDEYGGCGSAEYCFGRLPTFLEEAGTEMIIDNGETSFLFNFDRACDTAHAAWQALHDHARSTIVDGCNSQRPILPSGCTAPSPLVRCFDRKGERASTD